MHKKYLIGVLAVFVIIQFIRPTWNNSKNINQNDIMIRYRVSDEIQGILRQSCFDCHSNNTRYPWYAQVQPVGWWLQNYVSDGKRHLNFSEFGSYPEKKAKKKFEEIVDEVGEGEMPLGSYLRLHADAKLTTEQAKALTDWAGALK